MKNIIIEIKRLIYVLISRLEEIKEGIRELGRFKKII